MHDGIHARPRRGSWLSALGAALVATLLLSASALAAPGNNGTVKIDGVEFDQHPNNEPHVGCSFEVDWYGFEANVQSTVTFTIQPPSGPFEFLRGDVVQLDGDDASGGGSEAGWDGSALYDLSPYLSSYYEHPKQGFHVKLTVNTPVANGADVKHKVFWVQDCKKDPPKE